MSMSFSDAQNGMMAVYDEGVYITQDGGNSWTGPQLIADKAPQFVQLFSAEHAVVTFMDGLVAITADGGQNWEIRYENPSQNLYSSNSFFSGRRKWLACWQERLNNALSR